MKDNKPDLCHLQFPGFLKLLHVTLPFPRAAGSKEDILMIAVDILSPRRQPRHCSVVLNRFPLPWHIGNGNRCILPDIERNLFRSHPELGVNQVKNQVEQRSHTENLP